MNKKYTRKQVTEIVKIPDRRIELYTNEGFFTGLKKRVGRGIARQYSEQNILELFIAKKLNLNGIALSTAKAIIHKLAGYMLFRRMFNDSGDFDIKRIETIIKGQRLLFLIVYDQGTSVQLCYEGAGTFEKSKGNLSLFLMKEHDCALVLSLTDEVILINSL